MITALIGAQFGSEGKGAVAGALARHYTLHVRTGAPNAGHTVIHEGRAWKMRSVPCGWVNPDAVLLIGPGALVDVELLRHEVESLEAAGYYIRNRLFVDERAQVLLPAYHQWEGGTEGAAHRLIGSTGEGVGPARMAKIARATWQGQDKALLNRYRSMAQEEPTHWHLTDVARWLRDARDVGENILLEGAQGCGLSLTHGEWPFVTSCDTNAATLAADAGLPPQAIDEVVLVARTFPIRVSGNSGRLNRETSWNDLKLEPERTTVTQKIRRVGFWDQALVDRAIMLNQPRYLALTFLDYIDPTAAKASNWTEIGAPGQEFVRQIEEASGVPVGLVGVGPDSVLAMPGFRLLSLAETA